MWFRSVAISLFSLLVVVAQTLSEGTPGTPEDTGGDIPSLTIDLAVPGPEPDTATEPAGPAPDAAPEAPVSVDGETPVPAEVVTDDTSPDPTDTPGPDSETSSPPNLVEPPMIATPARIEEDPREVALPAVQIESARFSPIDPTAPSASSVGVISVIYTDVEPATEWVLAISFADFEHAVLGGSDPVATLTLIGLDGAARELPRVNHGEFRILPSIDATNPTHGTITLTFSLSLVDPVAGTTYSSAVTVTAVHRDDP